MEQKEIEQKEIKLDLNKQQLPYELIKADAEQRGLEPMWHFGEQVSLRFATEDSVVVKFVGGSDFKTWVNEAYQISSATWTNKVIEKTYEEKLESVKKERYPTVPFECFTFTIAIENVSRAILAQIQRHRGLYLHQFGYGELSTRNTDLRKCVIRIPKTVLKSQQFTKEYYKVMTDLMKFYAKMVDAKVPLEEARMVAPLGLCTYVTMTGNARTWIDYFNSRTNDITQYEHTVLVEKIINVFKEHYPEMWEIIQPKLKVFNK